MSATNGSDVALEGKCIWSVLVEPERMLIWGRTDTWSIKAVRVMMGASVSGNYQPPTDSQVMEPSLQSLGSSWCIQRIYHRTVQGLPEARRALGLVSGHVQETYRSHLWADREVLRSRQRCPELLFSDVCRSLGVFFVRVSFSIFWLFWRQLW